MASHGQFAFPIAVTCIKESIPHTALTDPTLVEKRLHSQFGLTGLTGLHSETELDMTYL